MINNERKKARRYDTPNRAHAFTERVYSGVSDDPAKLARETFATEKDHYPHKSEYNIYFGEMHGHTRLSDGSPDIDDYFVSIRDRARLDFAAITDHDHGGIGKSELFGEKWELIKEKVKKYYEPHKFTTILAYERDSYPWYNNAVVYYKNHDGEMLRGKTDGEITREELEKALSRDDIILCPHDTYHLEAGCDFETIDKSLFTPLIEIYSRGDCAEYFGTPYNTEAAQCEGGYLQDALKNGARMGCIAGSDDHDMSNGLYNDRYEGIAKHPGITGVLAKENTLEAIFDALKSRRCYGFTGGRLYIDFRINGHYMGEEISDTDEGTRSIYFNIKDEARIKCVTLVKNCRDYMRIARNEQLVFDYKKENETDVYYLRVELCDGRCGWTSPIWVNAK